MKSIISIFLILTTILSYSQKRNIDVNINLQITHEKITAILNSQSENLDHCKVQVADSLGNIVKVADFPKAKGKQLMKQYTETSILIPDLAPGSYTCLIYLGKEEMYKKNFLKEAVKPKN